jgi:single-stranded-DNA-specific exonuclease
MDYRWVWRPIADEEPVERLCRQLNDLPVALGRSLVLRGISTFDEAKEFFRPSLSLVHDPFLMKDMDAASDRLAKAIGTGENVLVYGDYDVDGTTSVALMQSFLRSMGVDATFYIPDRFKEGYGLSNRGIDIAVERGASLIVTLDCGITAQDAARYSREHGVDLVICDHHTAPEVIPEAVAVLDPKRPDCPYPFKELTGCGVGFKLVQATLRKLGLEEQIAFSYLDFVALSIASDIVPILGENRILMVEGLDLIRKNPRPGLVAISTVAGFKLDRCSTTQIVFSIGPRINAAGRLGSASMAVDLLSIEDLAEGIELTRRLESLNDQRRELDQNTLGEAVDLVEKSAATCMEHAIVLHRSDWHLGVIGIVASRLVERYYKPTILLASQNGEAKGSARSIANLNIYDVLDACSDLLTQFGGHMYAAGLTLPENNVSMFRDRLNEIVRSRVTPDIMRPEIRIDASVSLSDVTPKFWRVLRQFEPFGPENGNPVFHSQHLLVVNQPAVVGDGHLKFKVRQADGQGSRVFDVIGFGQHEHLPLVRKCQAEDTLVEMLFTIDENRWQGATSLQLKMKDINAETGGT